MAQYIDESVTTKVDYIYDMKVKIYNYIMNLKIMLNIKNIIN